MSTTKQIDPAALAGLTTGILMIDFSAVHEAAEWVLGRPVWTHQFPSLWERMRDAVLEQFPDMPTDVGGDWEACRQAVRERYGATVEVKQGSSGPFSPFDGLERRDVVAVVTRQEK